MAFVGVGQAQPDWKQLREDIAELLNDDKANNPSKDEGVQGDFIGNFGDFVDFDDFTSLSVPWIPPA